MFSSSPLSRYFVSRLASFSKRFHFTRKFLRNSLTARGTSRLSFSLSKQWMRAFNQISRAAKLTAKRRRAFLLRKGAREKPPTAVDLLERTALSTAVYRLATRLSDRTNAGMHLINICSRPSRSRLDPRSSIRDCASATSLLSC